MCRVQDGWQAFDAGLERLTPGDIERVTILTVIALWVATRAFARANA